MNLECPACTVELASYVAGEGDPESRSTIATHLAECPNCRRELEREIELRMALAGLPLVTCPTAVSRRVLDAIEQRRSTGRRRLWYAGAGTLAAAALAGALLLRPDAPVAPPAASGSANLAPVPAYTEAEIAAARRELIRTVTLTARILDRTGRSTLAEVFSERLPAAVAGSLRPLGDTTRGG
jgi:anti-sigma factor RsiW